MSELLTIKAIRGRFPQGAKPSEELLRKTAQRLGLGRRWGRHYLLTEPEAECLYLSGSAEPYGTLGALSRPAKLTVKSDASALSKALMLSQKLERKKSLPISNGTTTISPSETSRNVVRLSQKQR